MSAAVGSASRCSRPPSSASSTLATLRQSLPATSTSISPPNSRAAVSAFWVASNSRLLSCLASNSVLIPRLPPTASQHAGFVLQLADQLGHRGDLDAALAAGRLRRFHHFEPRLHVDAVGLGRLVRDRLLLRLHDVGKTGVARLVES